MLASQTDSRPAKFVFADAPELSVKTIQTGIPDLDQALCGGLKTGITELWGEASSGKTTIMLHVIARQQAAGRRVALIDTEHTFDQAYARRLGVDLRQLRLIQPYSAIEAAEGVSALLKEGSLNLVALDSIAAMQADQMGVRLEEEIGRYLIHWCHLSHRTGAPLLITNHMMDGERDGRVCFGDNREPAGGLALRHYVNLSMKVVRQAGSPDDLKFNLKFCKARQATSQGGLDLSLALNRRAAAAGQ